MFYRKPGASASADPDAAALVPPDPGAARSVGGRSAGDLPVAR